MKFRHAHRSTLRTATFAPMMLAILAGTAGTAHQAMGQFVFNPLCGGSNWSQSCTGSACAGGFFQSNNWGQSGCNLATTLPGPGNTANIGNFTVTLNTSASVLQVIDGAGGNFAIQGSLTTGNASTINGLWNVNGGNGQLTGTFIVNNTLRFQTGWGTLLTGQIDINGLLDVQYRSLSASSLVQGVINVNPSGIFRRTSGAPSSLTTMTLNLAGGQFIADASPSSLTFSACAITSTPTSTWSVASGSDVSVNSSTLSGTFNGTSAGLFRLNSCTFPVNSTVNIQGTGLDIFSTLAVASGAELTNAGRLMNVNGNNSLFGNITNTGTFVHGSGWGTIINGGTLRNQGTLDVPWRIFTGANGGSIENTGVITRSGTQIASFNLPVQQHGTVSIEANTTGSTNFSGSAVSSLPSSVWNVGEGSTLLFNSQAMTGTFNVNAAGLARIENVNFPSNTTINGSNQGLDISGSLNVQNGGLLTNAGLLQNIGGNNSFFGNITNTGTLTHSGGWSTQINGGTLRNQGTMNVLWRTFSAANNGLIENTGAITRSGTLAAVFSGPVNQHGTLTIAPNTTGTTNFQNSSVSSLPSSAWTVGANSTLLFSSQTMTGTFNVSAAGLARLQDVNFPASATINGTDQGFDINGSISVAGGAVLTNAGRLSNINGNNVLIGNITNTGTFTHSAGWNTLLNAATLRNQGTLDLAWRTFSSANGGSILNESTIRKTSNFAVGISAPLTNAGLIDVQEGVMSITGPFTQVGTGVIRTAMAGTARFAQGSTIAAGRIEGTGIFGAQFGPVNVDAIIAPGVGTSAPGAVATLRADGNVTLTSGGSLEIDLDRQAGVLVGDRLNLITGGNGQGIASLNGTLIVRRVGSTIPAVGELVRVLNCQTRIGTFAGVVDAVGVPGRSYRAVYNTDGSVDMLVQSGCGVADMGSQGGADSPDGVLDNNDFIVFIDRFFAQSPLADIGAQGGASGSDGAFDNNDFIVFINAFFDGCQQ